MQYRLLGDTGLIVSRLALGAMTFTTGDPSAVAKAGKTDAEAMLTRAG